jgi:hypothetical protein
MDKWPALPLEEWRDTYATLHMYTQVVGKVCLALTPKTNHFWNTAFLVVPRGLTTHLLHHEGSSFSITFNFLDHRLEIQACDGASDSFPLEPRTVADFYRELMSRLRSLGFGVKIWPMPVEVLDPIRFTEDTVHRSYDPAYAHAFWRALVAMKPVFERFRSEFVGKSSPVHFFWGSFDLAVTRFSGRRAPEREGADSITKEAYSHEVISCGFWPGGGAVPEPVFYAYAAPEPDGFRQADIRPEAAYYSSDFKEFMLPYEVVRKSESPESELMAFLESTYEAGATLAGWNRADLERK